MGRSGWAVGGGLLIRFERLGVGEGKGVRMVVRGRRLYDLGRTLYEYFAFRWRSSG